MVATIRKNYNSLDVLKFVCACLVVGIHTEPFENIRILDMGFGVITRNAVPIFFMISSFLFFMKEPLFGDLINYLKRIAVMYLFWIAVYLIVGYLTGGIEIDFSRDNIVAQIFSGGGYSSLWFLQALLVSISLVFAFNKIIKNKKLIVLICFILYLFGLILSTYYPLFSNFYIIRFIHDSALISFIGTRNGVFYAPIFVALGLYVTAFTGKHSKKFYFFAIIISLLLLSFEGFCGTFLLKTTSTVLWLCMIPVTYFTFMFVKGITLPDGAIYYMLRKSSTMIYLTHRCFIAFIGNSLNGFPLYIIVLFLSCSFSFLFYYLTRNVNCKFLKYIS